MQTHANPENGRYLDVTWIRISRSGISKHKVVHVRLVLTHGSGVNGTSASELSDSRSTAEAPDFLLTQCSSGPRMNSFDGHFGEFEAR
jgi:hypothetical protein